MLKEADTKGVPMRVNYPYPESGELLEMPATLLLRNATATQTGEVPFCWPKLSAGGSRERYNRRLHD